MKIFFTFLLSCGFLMGVVEGRTWTGSDGRTVEAEIVKATDTSVAVTLENGKSVFIKLDILSEDDQAFVKGWLEEKKKEEEAAKKAAKLAKITSFKWEKSYKKALADAQKLDLPLAILFTGTSWCPYCVKLEAAVFSKAEFKKLAAGKMIGVKIEAPTGEGPKSKEGQELKKKFGITGYPSIIYVDKDEKVIGRSSGYSSDTTPESFIKNLEEITAKK